MFCYCCGSTYFNGILLGHIMLVELMLGFWQITKTAIKMNTFPDESHQLEDLEEKLDSVIVTPSEPVSGHQTEQVDEQAAVATPTQSIAVNYSNRAVKYKV